MTSRDPLQAPDPLETEAVAARADTAPPADTDEADDEFEIAPRAPRRSRRGGDGGPAWVVAMAVAALAVVLAFGAGVFVGRATVPAGGSATSAPSEAAASPGPTGEAPPSPSDPLAGLPSDGPLLGSSTAKVQLTYWADFQCPFCAKFAETVLPQLASRIADGTVSVRHRDFVFLGQESIDAAISVRCGGEQGKYWEMHDAVYASQAGENQGAFAVARLKQIAASVGLDASTFTACLDRHDVLVEVMADTGAGVRAGVGSTPTVDIPGQSFRGVPDVAALLEAIDAAAAAGTQPTPAPSVAPSGDPWASTPKDGRTAGSASAKVTVDLWVDYQATGMPAVVQTLEPELRKRIAAGKVRLELRDLATLGDESVLAASLVRCSAQAGGSAWFTHDILGASAQGANAGVFTERNLLWLAAKLGDDVTAVDACMTDPATAAAITAETAVGTGMGFTAAPAVVVRKGTTEVARFSGSALDTTKILAAVDAAAK